MKIPEEIKEYNRSFITVGSKTLRFYLDPNDPESVSEFEKQFLLYESLRKKILTKLIKSFYWMLPKERISCRAPLIVVNPRSSKFFDFEGDRVIIISRTSRLIERLVRGWMLARRIANVPKILRKDKQKLIFQYYDFEFPELESYLKRTDDVVDIYFGITRLKRSRKISVREYLLGLPPRVREIIRKYLNNKELNGKIRLVFSHGDFHRGNLPVYKGEFYLLDYESFSYRPFFYDLAYFSFIPAHFNFRKYSKMGLKLIKKFLGIFDPSPQELKLSLILIRALDKKLLQFFEKNNFFLGHL